MTTTTGVTTAAPGTMTTTTGAGTQHDQPNGRDGHRDGDGQQRDVGHYPQPDFRHHLGPDGYA